MDNFEIWINSQNISWESKRLFNEGKKSFQSEAYSASLLFFYLMFVNIVRERILTSNAPSGINEPIWRGIQKGIRNQDTWDKEVFDALICRSLDLI